MTTAPKTLKLILNHIVMILLLSFNYYNYYSYYNYSPDALPLSFIATPDERCRQHHISYNVAAGSDDVTAVAVAGTDVMKMTAF